jgi:hypothetical protein
MNHRISSHSESHETQLDESFYGKMMPKCTGAGQRAPHHRAHYRSPGAGFRNTQAEAGLLVGVLLRVAARELPSFLLLCRCVGLLFVSPL